MLRSRRRITLTDPADIPAPAEPAVAEDRLVDDELRRAVRVAFASLPARCQELLRLATVDPPLVYAEIGRILDMPHGSIGPTRQRCLEQLRQAPVLRPFLDRR
jgi:RNA polymerase sigma factor (sigma-70 family)